LLDQVGAGEVGEVDHDGMVTRFFDIFFASTFRTSGSTVTYEGQAAS
jgi:hypothetical protein